MKNEFILLMSTIEALLALAVLAIPVSMMFFLISRGSQKRQNIRREIDRLNQELLKSQQDSKQKDPFNN
jgi:hypothetical protein